MSNYSPPILWAKLTGLVRLPDIAMRTVVVQAVAGRLSVLQAVGGAATARARFKSHALPINWQAVSTVSSGYTWGSA